MARHARACGVGVLLLALVASPAAAAANKEHQQMMADIRMLQEQAQQLQGLLAALAEALKTVTTRLDEQTAASRKAFADQKLLVDPSRATCASCARRWTTTTCGSGRSPRRSRPCASAIPQRDAARPRRPATRRRRSTRRPPAAAPPRLPRRR